MSGKLLPEKKCFARVNEPAELMGVIERKRQHTSRKALLPTKSISGGARKEECSWTGQVSDRQTDGQNYDSNSVRLTARATTKTCTTYPPKGHPSV